jgi:hypothetical protein
MTMSAIILFIIFVNSIILDVCQLHFNSIVALYFHFSTQNLTCCYEYLKLKTACIDCTVDSDLRDVCALNIDLVRI